MTNQQISDFLKARRGYIKKSPITTAKALWKLYPPRANASLTKDIENIKRIQGDLRIAKTIQESVKNDELEAIYKAILNEQNRPKRVLFFDIETSPNVVFSWRIGNKINLSHSNIINERAIICVCWKWQGSDKIYSLEWNKGDDKQLLKDFAKVINSADIVIGQNSDAYDIKWLRTRALYHGVDFKVKLNSLDTLKMARAGFNFNCNKLDYMGQYLGVGQKIETTYDLWKAIVLDNDKAAMRSMVKYCGEDVALLERVYDKLQGYSPEKRFRL